MPRGGARKGLPGKSYQNRTDMAMPNVASGQTYGKRAEQQAAQRSLPVGPPPQSPTPAPPQGGPAPVMAPTPMPGEVLPLTAPSERPGEPVTAGLPIGAGPGTEALGALAPGNDDVAMQLRAIYAQYPNEDLRQLLEMIDGDDGSGVS